MAKKTLFGYVACLFAVMIWGTTFTATKQLLNALPPTEILLFRLILAYGALWAMAPRVLKWQGLRQEACYALSGALGLTIYPYIEALALDLTTATSMVPVIVCTSPLITALLSRLFLHGKRLTLGYWIGFGLAMVGVILTFTRGDYASLRGSLPVAGLAFLCALTWATYTLFTQSNGPKSDTNALTATRRTFLWGALFTLPLCWLDSKGFTLAPLANWANVGRLLFLGIMASALCYAAWTLSVERLGGVRATLFLYLIPVIGVITPTLVLNEPITAYILFGTAATLSGVIISSLAMRGRAA